MEIDRRIIQPKSIIEQLLYSTVRICGDTGTGTGFFFKFQINETFHIELILTNKHVINGNKKLSLYFHEGVNNYETINPTNLSFCFTLENYSSIWVPHPNEEVDLGALLFIPIRQHIEKTLKKKIFNIVFDENLIKNDDLLAQETDVAEDILMLGYPIGLWDEMNNFPIVRKGITAIHPTLDFQDKSIGVVDIACFPGSSGSPILSYLSGTYFDKKNNTFKIGNKVILLGLLFGGPNYTNEGRIEIKEIQAQQIPITKSQQWIHLGYYVKAKEILVLSDYIKKKVPTTEYITKS